MFKYVAILFVALCAKFISAQDNKVHVDVYYESLCPDSIKFFTKQLYPSLQGNLSRYIDLKLVPYGKTTQTYNQQLNTWEFNCHHGPNECYGNKVQACALARIDGGTPSPNLGYNKVTLAFINCLMDQVVREPFDLPIRNCATINRVQNVVEIENCANHSDATDKLATLGHITEKLQPRLTSVPTIVFNYVYSKEDTDLAQMNFPKALCNYIRDNKPAECQRNGAPIVSQISIIATFISCFLIYSLF